MPGVTTADLDRLIDAFQQIRRPSGRARHRMTASAAIRCSCRVRCFPAVAQLEGDTGARHLVEAEGLDVIDVEIGEGAGIDVDTREALESAGGVLQD